MRNIIPQAGGRFLNDQDVADRRRVAVLGDELATLLFGDTPPVGEQIYLGDTPFTVIGVMKPKLQNSSYQQRDKDRIFIPASTHYALFGRRFLNNIVYRARSSELTKVAEQHVYETLGRKYRFDPNDEDALGRVGHERVGDALRGDVRGVQCLLRHRGDLHAAGGRDRRGEHHVHRGAGADPRNRDPAGGGCHPARHPGPVLRGDLPDRRHGGGLRLAALRWAWWRAMESLPIKEFVGSPVISPVVMVGDAGAPAGLVAFVAGLFPARKASQLDPIEALRT